MVLERILDHLHNYFIVKGGVHTGTFTVANGSIDLDFLQVGQYFKIVGSVFNDGVYAYPATKLVTETFEGEVWAMAVPPAVIALAAEIGEWVSSHPNDGYLSESFGGYSYSLGTNARGSAPAGWEDVFRSRLNVWRKVS